MFKLQIIKTKNKINKQKNNNSNVVIIIIYEQRKNLLN